LIFAGILVFMAFALNVQRSVELQLHSSAPSWVANAIPPVLSRILFEHDKRYTSLDAVHDAFYRGSPTPPVSAAEIDAAIASMKELDPKAIARSYRLLGPDDKGIVDFVEGAFRLFGLSTDSIIKAYLATLGMSALLFMLAFRRHPAALLALASLLVMHAQLMPSIVFNAQLTSPLALRAVPALSMIACLHCLLFAWHGRVTVKGLLLLGVQAALIIFVVHMRTPALWQVAAVAAGLVAALVTGCRSRASRLDWVRLAAPVLCAAIAYGALVGHRAVAFPIEYRQGEQIMTRVFWHNIFSDFALNSDLAGRYALRIDDVSVIRATGVYLVERGRSADWAAMGGASPNFSAMRWTPYDRAVRDMLFDRCDEHRAACAETILLDKPAVLLGTLEWLYGYRALPPALDNYVSPDVGDAVKQQVIEASQKLDAAGLWARPLAWFIVVAIGLGALLMPPPAGGSWPTMLALALLGAGSTIPSLVGYPAPHAVVEPAMAFAMVIQMALFVMLSRWRRLKPGV